MLSHARFVTAADLKQFAATNSSREVLPELIKRLVHASCVVRDCRIPGRDATNQKGLDGRVLTDAGFRPFVPEGESWWEVSNEKNPSSKADRAISFRSRRSADEKKDISFVFATFREWDEAKQYEWKQKHASAGFRELIILDATQIEAWLVQFPEVAKWLLAEMGLVRHVAGLRTVAEHWQGLQVGRPAADLKIPPQLFLIQRERAVDAITELFDGARSDVWLGIENGSDAQDFVAAVIASRDPATQQAWSSRCLFIDGPDEWMATIRLRARHVLVAGDQLDLEEREDLRRAALQAGHAIVVPTSTGPLGKQGLQLSLPSATKVELVLMDAGWPRSSIERVVGNGFSSLSVLKRRLAGEPHAAPAYAGGPVGRELALACLLGGWHESSEQDLTAVAEVLGQSFAHWRAAVIAHTTRPGTPLRLRERRWRFLARGEAWHALGSMLVDDDLKRFDPVALRVLGEPDPKFALSKEERWLSPHGAERKHTATLRRGLAETLALLGARSSELSTVSQGLGESLAARVVRSLLYGADAARWFALHDLLPVLAEAAPDAFLAAVEHALSEPPSSPFVQLFAQEGGPFGGAIYTSGLLWALETLAWHPRYLGRSMLMLAALASIDPGGQWMNRPANSLSTILLPWIPQTTAPLKTRVETIRQIAKKFEGVAWRLLLSLVPGEGQSSSGSHKPRWRWELIEGWSEGTADAFYIEQVEAYAALTLEVAAGSPTRVAELVSCYPGLPPAIRTELLEQVVPALGATPAAERRVVWEALTALAAKHRANPDAPWAMQIEEIEALQRAALAVKPRDPALEHVQVFDFLLPGREDVDYGEWTRRSDERRREAVRDVLATNGLAGIRGMSAVVKQPRLLGQALGEVGDDASNIDREVLPSWLMSDDATERAVAQAFLAARWQSRKWDWVDALDLASWTAREKATFFARLPVTREGWERAEAQLGDEVALYWQGMPHSPWMQSGQWLDAVEQLVEHGRPVTAVDLCAIVAGEDGTRRAELSLRALRASLEAPEPNAMPSAGSVQSLVEWLQGQQGVDQGELSMIEWGYLGVIDHLHGVGPKTLEARLATDPALFCEVIRLVYRSDREAEASTIDSPSPDDRRMASAAYRLLSGMQAVPGRTADGSLDGAAFASWLADVRRSATETGHLSSALSHVGQLIGRVATATDWMQTMASLAAALEEDDTGRMRIGFRVQLVNNRGVFWVDGSGRQEDALAKRYDEQAGQAETQGWFRLAAVLRELADQYRSDAERVRRDDQDS